MLNCFSYCLYHASRKTLSSVKSTITQEWLHSGENFSNESHVRILSARITIVKKLRKFENSHFIRYLLIFCYDFSYKTEIAECFVQPDFQAHIFVLVEQWIVTLVAKSSFSEHFFILKQVELPQAAFARNFNSDFDRSRSFWPKNGSVLISNGNRNWSF